MLGGAKMPHGSIWPDGIKMIDRASLAGRSDDPLKFP